MHNQSKLHVEKDSVSFPTFGWKIEDIGAFSDHFETMYYCYEHYMYYMNAYL